jgi:uncharacterized repeat protein (TIGR01451 family)
VDTNGQNNKDDNGTNNTTVNNTTSVDPAVNISITKVVNATVALNGDYLKYVINVTNHGPNDAANITVNEALDSRLVHISNSTTLGTSWNGSVWVIGSLANGSSAILTIVVWINGTGNVTNNVTVDTNGQNNTGSNGTNNTTEVLPASNVVVTKFVNATSALNGDYLTYIITVTNYGPDAATNVAVNEVLDSRLVLVSNVTTSGTSWNGNVWTIGTLNNGSSVTLTIVAWINGTGVIWNNVTVNTLDQNNTGDNGTGNVTNVESAVNLTITKTVNATVVLNGDYLEYVITVTNHGPDDAAFITVNEVLDSRLVLVSYVTSDGSVWNGSV